jgi:hypothetical protein
MERENLQESPTTQIQHHRRPVERVVGLLVIFIAQSSYLPRELVGKGAKAGANSGRWN